MTDVFFGDSQTADLSNIGQGSALLWPWIFSSLSGCAAAPVICAVGGSCAADQATAIYTRNGGADDRFFYMGGTVDHIHYGGDANSLALHAAVLHAEAYRLVGNFLPAVGAGWTLTGTWSSTTWSPFGKPVLRTVQNGATAAVQFEGDAFDLCYTAIDTNVSSFGLSVDGVPTQGVACQFARNVMTNLGQSYAPIMVRRSGFGPGTHMLVVTANIANGHPVNLDFLGAPGAGGSRKLYLLSCPRTAYPADDAKVAAYNATKAQVTSWCAASGMNVQYLDACADLVPGRDHCADNTHINNQGRWVVASAVRRLV